MLSCPLPHGPGARRGRERGLALRSLHRITPPRAPGLAVLREDPNGEQVVRAPPAPRAHPLALETTGDDEVDVVLDHTRAARSHLRAVSRGAQLEVGVKRGCAFLEVRERFRPASGSTWPERMYALMLRPSASRFDSATHPHQRAARSGSRATSVMRCLP